MARGWESKAVEAQIDEMDVRETEPRAGFEHLTPELRERLDALKMSRARTLEQLEHVGARPHRELLKRTLLALEKEIAELS